MSGETMELDLIVDKVTDAKGEDRTITVALKGIAYLAYTDEDGRHMDELEAKLTLKCGLPSTPKHLGIEKYALKKVLVVRDRDMSLESFEPVVLSEAEQQSIR